MSDKLECNGFECILACTLLKKHCFSKYSVELNCVNMYSMSFYLSLLLHFCYQVYPSLDNEWKNEWMDEWMNGWMKGK